MCSHIGWKATLLPGFCQELVEEGIEAWKEKSGKMKGSRRIGRRRRLLTHCPRTFEISCREVRQLKRFWSSLRVQSAQSAICRFPDRKLSAEVDMKTVLGQNQRPVAIKACSERF